MNIGTALKRIRKRKKLKQSVIAGNCGITTTYLSLIENNVKEPTISTLKKIAEELEVPLPVLLYLSLDESDIKPEMERVFSKLDPIIQDVISELLNSEHDQ